MTLDYEDFLAAHEEHEALADKLAAKIIADIIPFDQASICTAAIIESVADRLRDRAKDMRRGDETEKPRDQFASRLYTDLHSEL